MEEAADRYFLAEHAHVCLLRDHVVLLDVASGKYLKVDAASTRTLCKHVHGWPSLASAEENADALQLLMKRHLITRDPASGKPADPVQVHTASAWICELRPRGRPKFGVRDVWNFFKAAAIARTSLRTRRLQSIVHRVSRRKKARQPGWVNTQTELAELLRVFDWLRPLAFDKKDACFLYCLALVEFLAAYDVFPDWIFGVCDMPFRAHCWLQQQDHLLTDIPHNLRELTPIMVV